MTGGSVQRAAERSRRALRRHGWRGTLRIAADHGRVRLIRLRDAIEESAFDRRRGVDTRGIVYPEILREGDDEIRHYQAVRPSELEGALAFLPTPPEELTFVDLGCGKGKALLLAADAGFRRVIGVELSPALAAIASANVARQPDRERFEVVTGDAGEYSVPPEPLVLMIYNSFGSRTMGRVVDGLGSSLQQQPRPAYLIYVNPQLADLLDAKPFLRPIGTSAHFKVYAASHQMRSHPPLALHPGEQ